ncbi:uncharacterized protein RSE6_08027 [Rhynchosporium secalis]|uniref:Velvet domain-containing protein n=1 Tax=Rhynchosporium secalis TaxID=38038 RepID=A0A1E1MFF3_RHYSE|nr:uncharacterized protein RSE6_08027 [Rhynchosporium secalis]
MSLTHPQGGGFGGPPSRHPYRADSNPSRAPPPTLPSMSSLLNPEPIQQQPQYSQRINGHFNPPANMANQFHPLYQSQRDLNIPVQHIYRPPSPPANSQSSQNPQPITTYGDRQYSPANFSSGEVPLQRRQAKAITQRRADPHKGGNQESASHFPQHYYPVNTSQSPSQGSFEPDGMSSRRDSTFSESSSRGASQMQSSKMPISNILSEQPRQVSSENFCRVKTNFYRPVVGPAPIYSLRMRQQPVAARACGFGERDRRVIDPPPILQMHVSAPHLTASEISKLISSSYLVIHCILWDSENNCDASAMPGTTDKRQQRRLMGTLVASPFVGKDEHQVEGCFFTFPDLSVRTPGKYSLRFSLVSLNPMKMGPGACEPVRSTIISSDFQVFNAKDFGGMRASTELTKALKHQGCLISVKKGNSKGNREDEDDEEDEVDEGSFSMKRGKRSKR